MSKTFADTLGIPGVTVAQAVEILDGLTFTGPPPKIDRGVLLEMHWSPGGARGTPFSLIARCYDLHVTSVQNEHAAILRRLRWELRQEE